MSEIMPLIESPVWLDAEDYTFPGIREVQAEIEEENERHERSLAALAQKLRELKAGEQAGFQKLLTARGPDLREAVVQALRYLGFARVIDVDDYWKHVIRTKEEDIWLLDGAAGSVEAMIRSEQLTLVAVRSGEDGAVDDDGLLLQRYKGRRMQEFNNTKMQAVLVGNYFAAVEPRLRQVPFSEPQVNEAAGDGNGLLTTYELFKAIKAEKEGRVAKEVIREQLRQKTGLVTFEY